MWWLIILHQLNARSFTLSALSIHCCPVSRVVIELDRDLPPFSPTQQFLLVSNQVLVFGHSREGTVQTPCRRILSVGDKR